MSVITNIAGVPLFSTVQEALSWGASRGLTGYHIHFYQTQRGYMGGATHAVATRTTRQPTVVSRRNTNSGGSGY
tara:strand:+ start:441 stop:662 length:222 start_codon:yes stop_codon:yes gene_type:complete